MPKGGGPDGGRFDMTESIGPKSSQPVPTPVLLLARKTDFDWVGSAYDEHPESIGSWRGQEWCRLAAYPHQKKFVNRSEPGDQGLFSYRLANTATIPRITQYMDNRHAIFEARDKQRTTYCC